uniref:Uncharacterized protein n=1 Tax=Anopheles albimanus TaxID=7167 RepID=A0A182FH62_ANOAL
MALPGMAKELRMGAKERRKERLEELLQPQGYVSILEALGYAKQQRRDDTNLRRYLAKRQAQRIRQIRQMEVRCIREKIEKLIKVLRPYYLHGEAFPMEDDVEPIAEAVRFRVGKFLKTSYLEMSARKQEDRDVIDGFFVEFSEKVGRWIRELMRSHGLLETILEKESVSSSSVNTSEFEVQHLAEESDVLKRISSVTFEKDASENQPSSDIMSVIGDNEATENNTRSNGTEYEDGEATMVQDTQLDETEMNDIEGENMDEDQEQILVP